MKRKFYFWSGIFIIVVSVLLFLSLNRKYKIQQDGIIVKMEITKVPNSCIGTKVKHYARFLYKGVEYIKQVGSGFCDDHHVGEFINMKYLEGESLIMFPKESVVGEFYMVCGVALLGLILAIWNFSKKED